MTGNVGESATDWRDAIVARLSARAPDATICPSEVARAAALEDEQPGAWRERMPAIHAAIDLLSADHRVRLSWRGRGLERRAGPYRIGRGPMF